jgi:ComF family protein
VTHRVCKTPFSLDGLSSVWPYRGVIRKAVITLKYKYAYDVANEISSQTSKILSKTLPISIFKKILLVPIPLSRSRQNWRGFNQSAYLGCEIAKNLKWQFIPDFLLRKRFVKPQTGLTRKDRLKNIFGSFNFNPKYKKIPRAYQILVIDDVFTTGATMREVGRVLKKQGFKKVWGLTIAR